MDVALAADAGGVAKFHGDALDGLDDVLLGGAEGGRLGEFAQSECGEHGAGPGAEVFGGEVLAGDFFEIGVDVGGGDAAAAAVCVKVLEEFLAGDVAAFFNSVGEFAVVEGDVVELAAFAFEAETDAAALYLDVFVAHGGEAEGVIGAGVFVVADADEGGFEKLDDGGEHLAAVEIGELEILGDAGADFGKGAAELEDAFVLGLVAGLAPERMVAVLFAAACVDAGGLQMPVGVFGNPDVGPGGWEDEGTDALEDGFVGELFAGGVEVDEIAAALDAAEAGFVTGDIAELDGRVRVFPGFGNWNGAHAPGLFPAGSCGRG